MNTLIRKLIPLLALCLAFALPAMAQDELPQGVKDLCEARYPAYTVAAQDGWGDESRGQYALILTDGEDNILCIAEKAEGDVTYAFTIENTHAVREGADLPALLIDTGGDSLYYAYTDGSSKSSYASHKSGGAWSDVSIIHQDFSNTDYDVDTLVCVRDGYLTYDKRKYDKLENPTDSSGLDQLMPIPVSPEFESSMRLAAFDIASVSADGWIIPAAQGICDGLLEDGDTLLQVDVQSENILMLVRKADGTKRLRIAGEWDAQKNNFSVEETGPIPEDASMDEFHMWDGVLFLGNDGRSYNFTRSAKGSWILNSIQEQTDYLIGYNYVSTGVPLPYRNNGLVYGEAPWETDILKLDFSTLPRSRSEALAALDQSCYAYVNNPNPADRLHLRAKPQKSAASLGKFYNRTPVYVIERQKEWSFVRIGNADGDCLEGWMMNQFLAFGDEKESVECAFPQLHMVDDETPLFHQPKYGEQAFITIGKSNQNYCLIGVVGDEWYIVMTRDGTVGYTSQACFWEGNG